MPHTGKKHPELIAKKGEEIYLSKDVRGIIVLAEPKDYHSFITDRKHWVLLISHIKDEDDEILFEERKGIYRHLSYNIENGTYFLSKDTSMWGQIENYNFYLATEEQKQLIKDTLRKHHLKYVKALNTLIDR